ncbi:recombination protein RecR [Flavobacterium sp. CAN_S2]
MANGVILCEYCIWPNYINNLQIFKLSIPNDWDKLTTFAVMEFSSKLIEKAVNEMSQLPGIGKRTALRLVLHLLKQPKEQTGFLSQALVAMREDIKYCTSCHNISDSMMCEICANQSRNHQIICIVEDIRDVMAIENTGQFRGIYHVLGGKISPIDGVGPSQLNISTLVEKVKSGRVNEIIFALSSTMEGDTTNFYIYKQIADCEIVISTIARGISVGDELEYADEVTLGRSILHRVPFEKSFKNN